MEQEIIKLKQSPIIEHSLVQIGKEIDSRIAVLNLENQIVSEDTVKSLKKLRAEITKEFDLYESQRKAIKEAILKPYTEFEGSYSDHISVKMKSAISLLKTKIDEYEYQIKEEKKVVVQAYFEAIVNSEGMEFISFDKLGLKFDLSTSEKKYKEQVDEFIEKIKQDIELIKSEEYQAEMMAEFKITLNASKAIVSIRERKAREKQEAERILFERTQRRETALRSLSFVYIDITRTWECVTNNELFIGKNFIESASDTEWNNYFLDTKNRLEKKQEVFEKPIEKPAVEHIQDKEENIIFAEFRVEGTREQLIALGEYMKSNNIKYTNI